MIDALLELYLSFFHLSSFFLNYLQVADKTERIPEETVVASNYEADKSDKGGLVTRMAKLSAAQKRGHALNSFGEQLQVEESEAETDLKMQTKSDDRDNEDGTFLLILHIQKGYTYLTSLITLSVKLAAL